MTRPENVRCNKCCYFTEYETHSYSEYADDEFVAGFCMRYPPKLGIQNETALEKWLEARRRTREESQERNDVGDIINSCWGGIWPEASSEEFCGEFCAEWPGLRSPSYAPKLGDGAFTMLPAEMTGHEGCKIRLIWDEDHNAWTMWSSDEIFEEGVSST